MAVAQFIFQSWLLISFLGAAFVFMARKHRLLDYYSLYKPKWFPAPCEPCLALWFITIVCVIVAPFTSWWVLGAALPAMPLAIALANEIKK